MEARTNYSFERFDLHTVFSLMADVRIQRKGDVDSLQWFFVAGFMTACSYRLCMGSYCLFPVIFMAVWCTLTSLFFSHSVRLPNHAAIPHPMMLSRMSACSGFSLHSAWRIKKQSLQQSLSQVINACFPVMKVVYVDTLVFIRRHLKIFWLSMTTGFIVSHFVVHRRVHVIGLLSLLPWGIQEKGLGAFRSTTQTQ